jgi:hypothetical protein
MKRDGKAIPEDLEKMSEKIQSYMETLRLLGLKDYQVYGCRSWVYAAHTSEGVEIDKERTGLQEHPGKSFLFFSSPIVIPSILNLNPPL